MFDGEKISMRLDKINVVYSKDHLIASLKELSSIRLLNVQAHDGDTKKK